MPRWIKYSLITVGTIFGLLLLSMLVVPWQLKKQSSAWFVENTSRTLSIEKAFFNPFSLTVEIEGLQLSEQDGAKTFVSFSRLMLSGSVRSLIDLALILDRVELDDPFVNIELLGKQEFNFSDFTRLGGSQPQPATTEPDQPSTPLLFSINNIILTGGSIDFTDQTSEKKSQHKIRKLSLAIPFVGNVPYLTDDYVEPHLRFLLNGSELRAEGQLLPFHQSLETSLSLMLTEVDLSYYAFHSPVPLPVEVQSGTLDSQIDLIYRVSDTEVPQLLLSGELALSDIDIRELDGDKLFLMPRLILDLDQLSLLKQEFNLNSLDIYKPQLFVDRDSEGLLNLVKLLPPKTPPSPEVITDSAPAPAAIPLLKVTQLTLHDGKVHYQDEYPLGGFQETIQGINLQLENLSTHPEQLTELKFKLQTARQMNFSLTGQLGLNPISADLTLLLNGFQLKPHYPFLADLLTLPLEGNLNLASHIQLGPDILLKLEQMQLTLHQLTVPFTKQDHFTLQDLSITGGAFDLEQQTLNIGSIKLSKGDLLATRNPDGSLSPLALLRQKNKKSPAQTEPTDSGPITIELPWQKKVAQIDFNKLQLLLANIALKQFALQFTDASLPKKPQLKIDRLDVSLENLAYPKSAQSPFRLDAKIGPKGSVAFSGNLAHSPLRLQAQTNIKALPLVIINDFRPENLRTSLKDGKLFASLALKLNEQPEELTGSFAGRLGIDNLNVRDPLSDGELLGWESLGLEGIKGEISPFKLHIDDVFLTNYLAKILINKDGQINLASITASEANETAEQEQEPEGKTAVAEAVVEIEIIEEQSEPLDIQIDAVTLQGGTVSFTDRALPTIFASTMYQLGGRITGLSAEEQMRADVDLRGQLENHSPLTISGKLNPLSKDLYADLNIRFNDIDLVPLTPYSGTYVGYAIDKGKLYLDLSYHIEHRQIRAENRVMIDQFTFGEAIESEQATSLPVGLAIALLKDRSGEIHLDLPVSGDLDDPSFSIVGTIFTILKNLLVKVATSPFALLGSVLGSDEDFTSVTFASGSDQINEEQTQQLGKLAEMLADRPSLTLEISAFSDQDKDPEAYRQLQLQELLRKAKATDLVDAGQDVALDELTINPEEYPKYLTLVYKEADFPRPRNFVGLLKTLPVAEMEKLLLANIRAADEQMQRLAKNRSMAVRETLYAASEEVKAQIFLKNVNIYQKPDSGVASRVEFNISSK